VQIDVRAAERLRGKNPVNLGPVLSSLTDTLRESPLDLSRLRVVCDWVQYRQNFRNVVDVRQIMPSALKAFEDGNYEIAIDLRRAASIEDLTPVLATAIARASQDVEPAGHYIEDWKPASASVIWDFNGLYWNALGLWEEGTGREYEQALPGGESDARNTEAARSLIERLFAIWDDLAARRALPEDLHVLELGVGNGNQAKVWLDEFRRFDREQHKDYYRRLHYLMADYSQHVLERARDNVKEHASRCSSLVLDARVPTQTLGFLRSKAFLIYISNVYDNLPSDEIVRIGGHLYNVEVRAYIPTEAAIQLAGRTGIEVENLPDLVLRLLQLGPDLLARASPELFKTGPLAAVGFWRDVWESLRLEERYVPIEGLDQYRIANGITGEVLRPIVEANGDVRMQISNGAAASFLDSVPLLHPFGILECHDIFVTDLDQYHKSFRGPGKYDGSVVNWVNGALLAAVGRRNGYDVTYESFAYRSGSNITTLVARVQE
jgi:Putative S-adenosyl-L-methionine-dependent methyltransferase